MRQKNKILLKFDSSVRIDETMNLKLRMPNSLGYVQDAKVLFNRKGEKTGGEKVETLTYMKTESDTRFSVFGSQIAFDSPGYRTFCIHLKLNNAFCELRYDAETGEVTINDQTQNFWEMFVYYPNFITPKEIKGGIMYQIYIDTFCSKDLPDHLKGRVVEWGTYPKWKPDPDGVYRNTQWYGGNIKGVISMLDYLASLSVTAIYLTPIFKSSTSDRYGIDDYEEIDELVGTWDDIETLKEECHKRGMIYIQDEVFNHSGPNNRLLKEIPDAYSWIQKYTKYQGWWGFELPEFDKSSEMYYAFLRKVNGIHSQYVDGYRMDVADNMTDYSLKFIKKIFGKYMLLEVWKNAIKGDFREFLYGDEGDGVMNYQFSNAIHRLVRFRNAKYFKRIIHDICSLYPPDALNGSPIFLSSHDIPRIPNILSNELMKNDDCYENIWDIDKDNRWLNEIGEVVTFLLRSWEFENDSIPVEIRELVFEKHIEEVFLQYTLPGLPSIFAGDEIGTVGLKDPHNRKSIDWMKMLKFFERKDESLSQADIDERLYRFYRRIGKFRMEYREIFSDSTNFKLLYLSDTRIVYKRDYLVFIVNLSDQYIAIPKNHLNSQIFTIDGKLYEQKIPPHGAIVAKR